MELKMTWNEFNHWFSLGSVEFVAERESNKNRWKGPRFYQRDVIFFKGGDWNNQGNATSTKERERESESESESERERRREGEKEKNSHKQNTTTTKANKTQIFWMESVITSDVTSDITSDIFFLLTQHIFITRRWYAQDIVDSKQLKKTKPKTNKRP